MLSWFIHKLHSQEILALKGAYFDEAEQWEYLVKDKKRAYPFAHISIPRVLEPPNLK